MENARRTAVKLLRRVDECSSYSNIILDGHFAKSDMDAQSKKFCAALFYGTLERKLTLDKIIEKYSSKPSDKLGADVRNILRTALYQLIYMNGVPESAAVNEAVKLASKCRNPAVKNYVNGLLRNFLRADKKLPEFTDPIERLSFEYSCPTALVKKWAGEYGEEKAAAMLVSSLGRPPVTAKINTLRTDAADLIGSLADDGFGARQNKFFCDCLDIYGSAPENTRAYREGYFHVQDISCRFCCDALDVRRGMTVYDMCAAPGGKTFTLAELMDDQGEVRAFDLHQNRVRLIKDGAQRLGLGCVSASVNDAKVGSAGFEQADRVLCDVPCSGLGVIRRKPEIKYKELSEFERLPEVQYKILDTSARYVKAGGVLVYSTCTLSRAENEQVAERFLAEHGDFALGDLPKELSEGGMVTITPERFDSDGFFIAKFVRVK